MIHSIAKVGLLAAVFQPLFAQELAITGFTNGQPGGAETELWTHAELQIKNLDEGTLAFVHVHVALDDDSLSESDRAAILLLFPFLGQPTTTAEWNLKTLRANLSVDPLVTDDEWLSVPEVRVRNYVELELDAPSTDYGIIGDGSSSITWRSDSCATGLTPRDERQTWHAAGTWDQSGAGEDVRFATRTVARSAAVMAAHEYKLRTTGAAPTDEYLYWLHSILSACRMAVHLQAIAVSPLPGIRLSHSMRAQFVISGTG